MLNVRATVLRLKTATDSVDTITINTTLAHYYYTPFFSYILDPGHTASVVHNKMYLPQWEPT